MKPTPANHPEVRVTPYFPALDGLRALAVLMVLFVHAAPDLCPWGWMGVQTFFVLSGFLISGILVDSRAAAGRYRNFYARRALRIFPLYYGVLLLCGGGLWVTGGSWPKHAWLWLVYLQNFAWFLRGTFSDLLRTSGGKVFGAVGHLWSLAVEEQFYLIWPPIVFACASRRRLAAICGLLIAARLLLAPVLVSTLPAKILQDGFIYRTLPTQWDGFLMGALLALWLRRGRAGRPRATPHWRPAGAVAGGALLGVVALFALLHRSTGWIRGEDVFAYTSSFEATIGLPLVNLVSLCVVVAVIQPGTWAFRLCHLAPLRALGRVSYGFYVFHLLVLQMVRGPVLRAVARHGWSGGEWMVVLSTGVLTAAISFLSFRYFESPFLRFKDRLTVRAGRRAELRDVPEPVASKP